MLHRRKSILRPAECIAWWHSVVRGALVPIQPPQRHTPRRHFDHSSRTSVTYQVRGTRTLNRRTFGYHTMTEGGTGWVCVQPFLENLGSQRRFGDLGM